MAHFGNFDLKFAGVSLACDTEKKKEALLKFITGESYDYTIAINPSDKVQQVEDMLYNTTYFHECRHVHDYLLCPVLNYNYRLRLLAIFHAVQAANIWKDKHSYTYLPIPFKDWITLVPPKQQQLLSLKGIDKSMVPMYSATGLIIEDSDIVKEIRSKDVSQSKDIFGELLVLGASYYETFKRITQPIYDKYGSEYSVKMIVESMAYVHQATAMTLKYGGTGKEACQFLVQKSFEAFQEGKKTFDKGESPKFVSLTNYTSMFTFLYRYVFAAKIDMKHLYPFISHVLYWSLNGNLLDENAICSPIDRLHIYTERDLGNLLSLEYVFEHPLEAFAIWDKAIGSSPIDYTQWYEENCKLYGRLSAMFKNWGHLAMAEYTEMLGQSALLMSHVFLSNPSNYLVPENYLNNIYDFVNVPIRFDLESPIHLTKAEYLRTGVEHNGTLLQSNEIMDISTVYFDMPRFSLYSSRQFIPPSEDSAWLRHQISIRAEDDINFAEALFNSIAISHPERLIKKRFEGIKTWFFYNTLSLTKN